MSRWVIIEKSSLVVIIPEKKGTRHGGRPHTNRLGLGARGLRFG